MDTNTQKIYSGVRGAGVTVNGRSLAPRNDLYNHSPDGFEWGYGGSGPAQLALAICADFLGDDRRALGVYQDFKWRAIAGLQADRWTLTSDDVRTMIVDIENVAAFLPKGQLDG